MDIVVQKKDEVYVVVRAEPHITRELSDYFRFRVPGYQFMPSFRSKKWDGYIYLFSYINNTLYCGLLDRLVSFAKDREYTIDYEFDYPKDNNVSLQDFKKFIDSVPTKLVPRDYQLEAVHHAINKERTLLVSPTASGKSLIIYYLVRYHYPQKTLIVVPTISLVYQMYTDFEGYADKNFEVENFVHKIYGGQEKTSKKPIIISTWQSIYNMSKKYFEEFDVIIGDEAHLYKSKSLTGIMAKTTNAAHKIGTTGTLDGTQTHKLVLEGLFGPVFQVTTTKKLIDKKKLSPFSITCLVLKYEAEIRKQVSGMDYREEIKFLIENESRNRYIKNLVLGLNGNSLLLFQLVENHGKVLYDLIKKEVAGVSNRKTFFVYGGTDANTREHVRAIVENERDAIIVASYGVFSTGVNIRNLNNIIFSSPSKSRIRNLQSIGRGLRLSENKEETVLYDISDDLTWNNHRNYTINHFAERIKIYNEEQFEYKMFSIGIR